MKEYRVKFEIMTAFGVKQRADFVMASTPADAIARLARRWPHMVAVIAVE